jgi:hypothetical protein
MTKFTARRWTPPDWLKFVMKKIVWPGAYAGAVSGTIVFTGFVIYLITALATFVGVLAAWYVLSGDITATIAGFLAQACSIGLPCEFRSLYIGFAIANIIILNFIVYIMYALMGRYGVNAEPDVYVDDVKIQTLLYLLLVDQVGGATAAAVYSELDGDVHDRIKEIWEAADRLTPAAPTGKKEPENVPA